MFNENISLILSWCENILQRPLQHPITIYVWCQKKFVLTKNVSQIPPPIICFINNINPLNNLVIRTSKPAIHTTEVEEALNLAYI